MTHGRDTLRFARRAAASAVALAALWASQACVGQADSCPEGLSVCAAQEICTDLKNDPENCGKCGVACAAGQACSAGACGAPCTGIRETRCPSDGACHRLEDDPKNCGGCGVKCATGADCFASQCRCPGDGEPCNGLCCDYTETCVSGACVPK